MPTQRGKATGGEGGGNSPGHHRFLSPLKVKTTKNLNKLRHMRDFYHVLKRSKGDELCALIRSLDDKAIDQICELFYNIMVS